jgi:6-phosphogluconolactonase
MSNVETLIFKDREDLVHSASEVIAERIGALSQENKDFHIAITGGTVGTQVLEAVGRLTSGHDLSKLHIWWVDDRFVPRQSQDRNELQARTAWLSASNVAELHIHAFPAEEFGSVDDAAKAFAKEIEEKRPIFEMALLGMGEDGHVASIFPESKAVCVGDWVVVEKNSPKPPATRLSLSVKAISSSKEVLFLVSGIEKAHAVSEVLSGLSNLPASKVSGSAKTTWFLDADAASKITSS